ncbi:MAG: hypothetical protein E6Q97_13385 [Desulfurellales bacterium]|nr:MAG: hypothetical protein E6Q97_13385 [Desulfurellales bacterium]
MSSKTWLKFNPKDWQSDVRLKSCSLAARGLWIEMIAIMHESPRYGHLVVGEQILDAALLSALVGATTREVSELLGHLEKAGVFTKSSDGAIYSRRMVREYQRSNVNRKNVKKRWKADNVHPPDLIEENEVRNTNRNTRKRVKGNPPKGDISLDGNGSIEDFPKNSWQRAIIAEHGMTAYRTWLADADVENQTLMAGSRAKVDWIRTQYALDLKRFGVLHIEVKKPDAVVN